MANRVKLTSRRRALFLDSLRANCNISAAARILGVERSTVYHWRATYPDFAAEWDEAIEEGVDRLEREAWRRAHDGYDKPIVYQGEVHGTYKEYSDRLMELLLKAHRPEKYKDRVAAEHSGADGGPLTVQIVRFGDDDDTAS